MLLRNFKKATALIPYPAFNKSKLKKMKKTISLLLIAAGVFISMQSSAQSFNAKLKFGGKDGIDVIISSSPAYKDVIQAGVTIRLDYYQHSSNGNQQGNANMKSFLAKFNEHAVKGSSVSTLFTLNQGVVIEGQVVPAGTYGMFTTINGEQVILLF